MPAIIGSIPDAEAEPIVRFLEHARETVGQDRLDYNELLLCLLLVMLERGG